MPNYNFTLILDRNVEAHLDALYQAGCDDATFGSVDGVYYAEFFREAPALVDAISSAIATVESVPDLHVIHIEPDDLLTLTEMAERLGRTRESVGLLVAGERGTGDFPAPTSHLRSHNRLWRWSDVAAWAGTDLVAVEQAQIIAVLNAALELCIRTPEFPQNARRGCDFRAIY